MHEQRLDGVLVVQHEHVQYLTGHRFAWVFSPAVFLAADGQATLVAPEKRVPERHAADVVIEYSARHHSTMRNDQRETALRCLSKQVGPLSSQRVGVEFSSFPKHVGDFQAVDIEPELYRMRRKKSPDELALVQRAIDATERMYERAREIIEPGINELDLFNELQSAAVRELGEMLTGTGNDYQCASRGGAPRNRVAEAGELYILDLGPAYRGYFADNARTIAVSEPTKEQLEAWTYVVDIFDMIEAEVCPGVSAKQIFQQAQTMLDRCPHGIFNHHLGHGIGLFPHEGPHLNPHWDDRFELGDVFTAEPGVYGPELNQGMRIENDYILTETGLQRLTNFPLELKL